MPMIVYTKTMFVGTRKPEDVWLPVLNTYSSKCKDGHICGRSSRSWVVWAKPSFLAMSR